MPHAPIRILVVEDEAAHAAAILRSLEDLEATDLKVVAGLAGYRDVLAGWTPDIALVDLNLPDGQAMDVLPDPGEERPFPIVIMTSYGSEQIAVESMKRGAFDYLVKSPESFRALPRQVERLLREWQGQAEGKRMRRELAASEAKYRSLAESTSDFIMRFDRQHRHTYLNPAALRMLGMSEADTLGKTHAELGFPEHLWRFWEDQIEHVFVTGKPLELEFEFPREGRIETHDWHLTPERGAGGMVHSVLGVSRDITERKKTEEALREAHRFNEQIIRSAQEGIIVYGPDLRYQVWNPFMEALSGRPASEVCGRLPWEVFPFHRDTGLKERLERTLAGELVDAVDFKYRLPGTGQEGWTADSCSPFRNSRGEIVGVIATVQDITERKLAEDVLRASENKQRAMIANISDVIAIIGPDGTLTFKSPNVEKFFGWKPEELVGQSSWNNIHPDDRARIQALFERIEDHPGASITNRCRYLHKDGRYLWTEFTAANLLQDHDIAGVLINYHDISERIESERALKASRDLFTKAFETNPDAIAINRTSDGVYIAINQGFTRMSGYTPEDLVGRSSLAEGTQLWVEARDRQHLIAALREKGEMTDLEARFRMKDGHEIVGLMSAKLIEIDGVLCNLSITRDITERKRAEQALLESEARNRALLDAIPDLIFTNRRDGAFLGVKTNDPASLYLPPEAFLHRGIREVLPAPFADLFLKAAAAALDSSKVQELTYTLPMHGELRHFEARVAPSAPDTVITIVRDVTERQHAEEQQRRLEAQLRHAQKMESLGSLAGGVAHDMNNVLGAILGLASANLEILPPGSPGWSAFDTIAQAAIRGGKMVKSLLSFARQSPSEEQELDLNALLMDEIRLLERTTLARIDLKLDLVDDLHPVRGDASALSHAIMNLCVNAVDAMPDGGTLRLRTRNIDQEWIEVAVEDTGTGMPKDVLDKAMDPYFTTKEHGKGTGLGLSLVYSTVKAHQGQLDIHSEPGRGTLVNMRFPACEPRALPSEMPSGPQPRTAREALNVLVVDDDELIRSSMLAILEVLGHVATAVSCGEAALAALEAGLQPEVIVLDMNMPGLGGSGTLPRLRALRPDVPVLLATGRADRSATSLVEAHSGVTLLSKPFSMAELQSILDPIARQGRGSP